MGGANFSSFVRELSVLARGKSRLIVYEILSILSMSQCFRVLAFQPYF